MVGQRPNHFTISLFVSPINLLVGKEHIDDRTPQIAVAQVLIIEIVIARAVELQHHRPVLIDEHARFARRAAAVQKHFPPD
jgi:hypothetical protein